MIVPSALAIRGWRPREWYKFLRKNGFVEVDETNHKRRFEHPVYGCIGMSKDRGQSLDSRMSLNIRRDLLALTGA